MSGGGAERPGCQAAWRSLQGSRDVQQDSLYLSVNDAAAFAAVCDGMGGLEDGAAASQEAAAVFQRLYVPHAPDPRVLLHQMLRQADAEIFSHGKNRGTTAVLALVEGRQLYWASVGDSRMHIIRGGHAVQATREHNYLLQLDALLDEGSIDKETYDKELARSGALISYLGMGALRLIDLTAQPMPICAGDRLLLSSDGLFNALREQTILRILQENQDVEQCADKLCACVEQAGRTLMLDNTTFILIEIR